MSKETVDYQPNRNFWNIAKGLGIILVIIGHACIGWTSNYVYMFHLQLFFFISGYLYNEKKYGSKPWNNVTAKLKSLWLPYFFIIAFFVLFHNVFLRLDLQISDTPEYSITEILIKVCNGLFGYSEEILAGPSWFLRTLAMAMIIFGVIVFLSRVNERYVGFAGKIIFQVICVGALAVIGYPLIINHIQLPADMQIAFVVMPFIWVGYMLRNYKGDIEKLLNPIVAIIAFAIVAVVSCFKSVDFAMGWEFPYMHVISLLGIYGCLYVVKLIAKFNTGTKIMAFIGELSLYIMFIHFFILRVMDRIICNITGEDLFDTMPVSFPNLWWLYLLICVPVSIGLAWLLKKCVQIIKKAFTDERSKETNNQ